MVDRRDRYAVVFRERDGLTAAGSLELGDGELLLSGGSTGRAVELTIPFADVVDVHVGRERSERLNGYPTLVLEREAQSQVQVAPLGAGLLHEIAELVTTLTAADGTEATNTLAVIVPLRAGCLDRARRLLERGPPIDPGKLGLASHHVYLREDAAVFVFVGEEVHARVRQAIHNPALWRAGIAWRDCIAGQPRVNVDPRAAAAGAALAYSWQADQP